MTKFLLVVVAAVAVSSWAGGAGFLVAAQGSPIIFRDSLPPLVSKEKPACATEDGGVCENDPDYDARIEEHIKSLLQNNNEVSALVNDPSLKSILNDVEPDLINVRLSETERPVCAAQETLIFPKRAKTTNDEWVFVPNQEGVQQAIRVEKCIGDGSGCSFGMVLPGGAKASCRQKYVYRRMLVLGTNKIQPEEVLMPSCCICYTTYDDLFTRTLNGTRNPPPAPQPMTPRPPTRTNQPMSGVNLNFARRSRSYQPHLTFPRGRR